MPLVNNNAPAQMAVEFQTLLTQYNAAIATASALWPQMAGIVAALRQLNDDLSIPFTGPLSAELSTQLPSPSNYTLTTGPADVAYGRSLFDSYNT